MLSSKAGATASGPIIRLNPGRMRVKETLQNQYGSHLIHHLTMAGKRPSGGLQVAMGFGRCEAFVPEVNRHGKGRAQRVGKGLGFDGLGAHVSGHVQRMAEDDSGAAESAQEAAERFQVLFLVFSHQSHYRLRGEPEFVRNRDADAPAAEIEAHEAGLHNPDTIASTWRKPHLRMG